MIATTTRSGVRTDFHLGRRQLLIGKDAHVGVSGTARSVEAQIVHVRGRLLAAKDDELRGVIVPSLIDRLGADHYVAHEVERQAVRLLVVATGLNLPSGALHHHAAVELGERFEFFDRNSIVDEWLDGIDVCAGQSCW